MNYNEDRNRKITKYGHRAKKQQQDKNTGLTLPPPPGRRVHAPHNIQRGGRKGGWVLWRPRDRLTRDRRPPGWYTFRDPWRIRQFRVSWRSGQFREPWQSREPQGPWRNRQSSEPWWSRELRESWRSRQFKCHGRAGSHGGAGSPGSHGWTAGWREQEPSLG